MEALSAGVPLVVSDLPVFRELFGSVALFGSSLTSAMRSALTVPDPERVQAGRSLAAGYTR